MGGAGRRVTRGPGARQVSPDRAGGSGGTQAGGNPRSGALLAREAHADDMEIPSYLRLYAPYLRCYCGRNARLIASGAAVAAMWRAPAVQEDSDVHR